MKELDAFVRNELSAVEARQVLDSININAELKEELDVIQNFQSITRTQTNNKLKALLQKQELKQTKVVSIRPRSSYKWMMLAASLLFGVLAIQFLLPTHEQGSHKALYSENFTPYVNEVLVKERASMESNALDHISNAYDEKKYDYVISSIDKLAARGELEGKLQFYKAISLMALDKQVEAKGILLDLKKTELEDYSNQIAWYLSLIAINNDQKEEAAFYLQSILDSDDYFRKTSAERLIKQLKN